jgi:cytochrome c oxidase subunit III
MAAHEKSHPYHMVDPSPWPVVGSIAALTMAIGGVMYMHDNPPWVFAAGFALLLVTFFGWWRDVVREANSGTDHTVEVQHGLRMGMLLFIASEVMFFFAFFWAYFHASIPFLSKVAQEAWPPAGIVPLETWDIPFLNTLILLTSGVTVTYAHHAIQLGDRKRCANGLLLTVILGMIFTGFQAYEYGHAAFQFTDGIYPSTFYLATGFHGAHVIIGTCFLLVCFLRAKKGDFTPKQHIGFEAAAWYWHFVDVVWLFLFSAVYWWGSAGYNFEAVGH